MNNLLMTLLAIGVYIVVGLAIAFVARRNMGQGMNDFFLGNRQIGGFVAAMTYAATTYSAFMMVGLAGLTYKMGVGALGFELTYLGGLVLVVFFAPRFWLAGRRFNYLTHAQLLADRYQSPAVGVVATLLCLVFLIPYAAIQVMGIGYLLAGVTHGGISLMGAMLLAVVLALVWSNMAGLRSVAWTDALQAVIMLTASMIAVLFVVYKGFGGFGSFFSRLQTDTPELLSGAGLFKFNVFLGISLPWMFFSLSNPQVTQRLFIPKSVKALKQMTGGFLIFGLIYTLVSVLWGFGARLLIPGLEKADKATPALLGLEIVPDIIVVVVMVGILAAAISTIDSILLTLSSLCSRDIYKAVIRPGATETEELRLGKWLIPLMALVFFVFAFWASGKAGLGYMIAPLSAAASAGLLMAVPSIIGAFFWRRGTAAGALTSMTVGALVVLALQISGAKPLGMWPGIWGFLVSIALYLLVSLVTSPPKAKAEEFLQFLDKALSKGNFI
jgi:SSS family solute:Na+ symporter